MRLTLGFLILLMLAVQTLQANASDEQYSLESSDKLAKRTLGFMMTMKHGNLLKEIFRRRMMNVKEKLAKKFYEDLIIKMHKYKYYLSNI